MDDPRPDSANRSVKTPVITRGVCRLLVDMGYSVLTEFPLGSGRRVDVAGVKSSLADFRADRKWPQYLDYCDSFYFAVDEEFPRRVLAQPQALPARCGLIVADRYGGAVLRPACESKMHGARRRAELLRFARKAASRWHRGSDPTI